MSRIRDRDTGPEMTVRRILHRLGYRFRLHRRDMPGKPDIVLTKFNTVIFVQGCFWHRHPGCQYAYMPKTRTEFWERKFQETVARDARNSQQLRDSGWKVLYVWECEVKDMQKLAEKLNSFLQETVSDVQQALTAAGTGKQQD